MEMMRRLRAVNVDHLHVGWYQSTYLGSFVNKTLLDSQFSYQSSIEESVVLIYGEQFICLFVWRCVHGNKFYISAVTLLLKFNECSRLAS